MAIRIPIIADVVDAIRGTRKLGESFDDVADALDDVDHASDKASRAVEDVGDAATSTKRDAEQMEGSFSDAFDSVRKDSSSAGKAVGDDMHDGTRRATEGVGEFRDEANSTAREAAASFDGSAASIGDAFQEVAANAFAGFGPAGAVAGLAAAGGIGLVTKAMGEAKETAQETAQEVADIAGVLIDLGSARLGPDAVNDALKEMATTADDGKVPLNDVADQARKAGIDFKNYARGLAGDSTAIRRSYDEVEAALASYKTQQDKVDAANGRYSETAVAFRSSIADQRTALYATEKALLAQDATLNQASETAQRYADATAGMTEATEEASAAADEAAARQEAYGSTLESMGEASGLYADAQDAVKTAAEQAATAAGKSAEDVAKAGQAAVVTLDSVLAELAAKVAERSAFEANLKTLGDRGFRALADELREGGPEVNGAVTGLLANGSDAQVQQYARDQGALTGNNYAKSMIDATGTPEQQANFKANAEHMATAAAPKATIDLYLDTRHADGQLAAWRRAQRDLSLGVQARPGNQQAV